MATGFDERLYATVQAIASVTTGLLDEEAGSLSKALRGLRDEFDGLLAESFDEDSKSSVLANIDRVVRDAAARMGRDVRGALDPEAPDSPLGRTKRAILGLSV